MSLPETVFRQQITEATMLAYLGREEEWGVVDCITIAGDHVHRMGHHSPLNEAGTWHNERQAIRALSAAIGRMGLVANTGLGSLVEARFPQISVLEAMMGDLVGFEAEAPWGYSIGIAVGAGQAGGMVDLAGKRTWRVGALSAAKVAWRVTPCQ